MTTHTPPAAGTAPTDILVEQREGVAIVTLNRPHERNPLGLAFPDQMLGVLQQLDDDLELPVIAAVNGAAVGGGAALAMACDIAVASDRARYSFAFGRLGAAACDMGCSYLLPRIVGSVRARHWLLTGASVDAEAGRAAGLFVDVVSGEQLRPASCPSPAARIPTCRPA